MLCIDVVEEMLEDNFLIEIEKGRYKINDKGQILTGTFVRKSNGKNSFIPEEGGEPIFIAERNSAHAMNNDKVKVALCAKRKKASAGSAGNRDSGTRQRNLCRRIESQ